MIVRKFHEAFGLHIADTPPLVADPDLVRLRARLIAEEFREVMDELAELARTRTPQGTNAVLRNLTKELADLRYVIEGAAVSLGLPLDEAYAEVHRSNMSKLGADGKPIYRQDGKVLKGPNYSEADMSSLLPFAVTVTAIEVEGG
jgi:predicted HAD superfamily Cof-like phosphohydrolase